MARIRESDAGYRRKITTQRILKEIVCIILCIMSIIPFFILFVNASRTSEAIKAGLSLIPGGNLAANWANFNAKQNGMQLTVFKAMINSFIIAVPSTFLSVYFSTLTAYGIHVYDFKLKKAAWSFILAVMIVPTTISAIGFYRFMLKLNLLDTYWPLILPSVAAPAIVFFMKQYMESTLSKELVEAARIDGSSEFRIFAFVASWNNLFMPNMIITTDAKKTLPLFVQMLRSDQFKTDYGVLYIGLAITILPIFVVYFILSKNIVAGVTLGGVKE